MHQKWDDISDVLHLDLEEQMKQMRVKKKKKLPGQMGEKCSFVNDSIEWDMKWHYDHQCQLKMKKLLDCSLNNYDNIKTDCNHEIF